MTRNQIAYWELLQTKVRDAETQRSNKAREAETHRSNRANEIELNRANRAREFETNRSNMASELQNKINSDRKWIMDNKNFDNMVQQQSIQNQLSRDTLNETSRHNLATEMRDMQTLQIRRDELSHQKSVLAEQVQANRNRESLTDYANKTNRFAAVQQASYNRDSLSESIRSHIRNENLQSYANAEIARANRARESNDSWRNQIAELQLAETTRHNKMSEIETFRHNASTEAMNAFRTGAEALTTLGKLIG